MSRNQNEAGFKEARRKKIIDAAYGLFVERKIEPVSMGEIAEAAGVGRSGKARYERASMEVVIFDAEDVITTSTGDGTIKLPFVPRT